jgi:lipid-A-disaccharide synthase
MSDGGHPARVLIVAGEASGDLYGGLLMRAMGGAAALRPPEGAGPGRVRFTGIGGPSMREAGLAPLADASALGVTGVLEVAARFGSIWRAWRAAGRALCDPAARPDLAILIDYPDFNLRLAGRARRAGVPVLYFVSPQVWAWRRGRLRRMAQVVDRMLVILPFEETVYREAGVPVTFVGHPLLDLARAHRTPAQERARLGLDARRPMVALLPGSRPNELRAHLGPMLGAARLLAEEFRDLQFALTVAPTVTRDEMQSLVAARPGPRTPPVLVTDDRYDAVAAADLALVASGTATLETALLGVPMIIVYRMHLLTYLLARLATDLPHIGMPNLIAGRRVAPELVQGECNARRIASEARRLLTEPATADAMRRDLAEVRSRLGGPGAIGRAAQAAWDMIAGHRGGA